MYASLRRSDDFTRAGNHCGECFGDCSRSWRVAACLSIA